MTASHAKANDMIVHFGHCCLSTEGSVNQGKNILYVLPKQLGVNWDLIKSKLVELQENESVNVLVYCDLALINKCCEVFNDDDGISIGSPDSNLVRTVPALA